ncbi:MarR family winged helix-turn-helix transcriptional regulator [Tissierella creatinophila]|nr:MarR family transcriptional regulator [Tissierella creatinophila]
MIDKDSLYFAFLNVARVHYYRTHILLSEIGIYHGQPPLLFTLEKSDGLSQREIADILKITPSTINVMLKRMEKSGLLIRKQDLKDQRVSRVHLTSEGRDICKKAKEAIEALSEECFNGFSLEEKETLKLLLQKMGNNLKEKSEKNEVKGC